MNLKFIRNITFWTFLVLYFVAAPIISLHALGYVIDPNTFRFVKTGIISISTDPDHAAVWLNDKLQHETTPAAITGLLPNQYRIKIEANGYQPVELLLNVAAEEVTKVERLLLIPQPLKIEQPVSVMADHALRLGQSRLLLLLSQGDRQIQIHSFDLRKKKLTSLLTVDKSLIGEIRNFQAVLSEDEKKIVILLRNGLRASSWLVSLAGDVETLELSSVISEPFSNLRFHPKNSKELFFLAQNDLYSFDCDSKIRKKIFSEKVRSFEIANDRLFIFTNDSRLVYSNLQGKEVKDLLPERGLYKLLFGENDTHNYQMFLTAEESAFWLRDDGALITNRLPHFIDDGVKGAQPAEASEKLFYWKSNELWMIDMEVLVEREKSFFEKGPQKTLLFSTKRPIVFAQTIHDDNQLIVATDQELLLIQSQPNLIGKTSFILKHHMKKQISFFADEPSGDLYWLDYADDDMLRLKKTTLFEGAMLPFSIRLKKPFSSPSEVDL